MSTQAQILANRRNAQKSTGPKTKTGKTAVSKNAIKHGLLAAADTIAAENPADFQLHRQNLLEELDPASPLESALADRLISLSWRLKRATAIQNQTIDELSAPKPPSPLERLTRSIIRQSSDTLKLVSEEACPELVEGGPLHLGRMAVKDFSDARVLERLLMYERRLEHSLYRTILEIQRLKLIKKMQTAESP